MNKASSHWKLLCLTLIYLSISAWTIHITSMEPNGYSDELLEDDLNRNERSTPRSFILPSTPAVAEEQDRKKEQLTKGINNDRCVLKLKDLGYPIDVLESSFNAKFIEAIILFQNENSLPPTGIINIETRIKLDC